MSRAYNIAKKTIEAKKKSEVYCINLVECYYKNNQITSAERLDLLELIDTTYNGGANG